MDGTGNAGAEAFGESGVLLFPPFRLDPANKLLWHGDQPVPLRPKSFSVLHHLLTHAGRLVTKRELLDAVWHDVHVGDANIKTAIKEIRRALGDSTETPRFVATVHRHGYRFISAVRPHIEARKQPAADAQSSRLLRPYPSSASHAHEAPNPMSPLAGRDVELSYLTDMLTQALDGKRQLALLTGPPGIGKSALLDAFLTSFSDRQDLWLARGQCLPNVGQGEPYLPMLEILGSLCREPGGPVVQAILARYAPAWLAQLPALLTDAELNALQRRISGMGSERMVRQMAEAVEALAAERPVVFCFDDLQWCDRATLELIDTLVRRQPKARLLVVGAYRSTEMADVQHPVLVLRTEMQVRGLCQEFPLQPLPQAAVVAYCANRFGTEDTSFLSSLARLVHEQSGGHPLFMTAIVNDLVRREEIVCRDGHWGLLTPVREAVLPAGVREFVASEFDRLDGNTQLLLEAASVLGSEFSVAGLSAALVDEAETDDLETLAKAMARRRLFLKLASDGGKPLNVAGQRFAFCHDLYRETVYARLASGRRRTLHRRIGEWQERTLGDGAREIAGTLAVHFEACEDWFRSARYHRLAGERAQQRHAPRVAAEHARRGIALIQSIPPNEDQIREELLLRQLLAVALITSDGFAASELSANYSRADELCREIEDFDSAVAVLCGIWNLALNQGDRDRVREVTGRLLSLAGKHPEPVAMLQAHNVAAQTRLFMGEFEAAEPHLERCLALCNQNAYRHLADTYGESPEVVIRLAAGWTRWVQGHSDQARCYGEEALRLSRAVGRPFAVEQGLWGAAVIHQHCGDVGRVHAYAEELIRLCRKAGTSLWLGGARILRGWALVQSGRRRTGIASLRRGVDQWRATGTVWLMPYYLCLLANTLSLEGADEETSDLLAEARAIMERTGERWYDAELSRLAGEHARRCGDLKAAENWFRQGMDVSRRQGARSWELRAAVSLADLSRAQGGVSDAYGLLAAVYGGFAEGIDTADLENARTLLETLK